MGRIQQLREALKEERLKMEAQADICQQVTHGYMIKTGDQKRSRVQKPHSFIEIFNCLLLLVSAGIQQSAGAEEKTQRRQQEVN